MARQVMRTTPDAVLFSIESLSECMEEYFQFVHSYWDQAPENENEVPLEFDRDVYERMDKANVLWLVVGRYYGKMVAAALYLVIINPKHKSLRVGQCDTFAVAREWRGQGLGKRMMQIVVNVMRNNGVDEITNGFREVFGDTQPLFEKLGFVPHERWYRLVIPTRVADETDETDGPEGGV